MSIEIIKVYNKKYHNNIILPLYSKYGISHSSSSLGMFQIYNYLKNNINPQDKIILGKPYGILSWFYEDYSMKEDFSNLINELKRNNFDGVLTQNLLEKIKFSEEFDKFKINLEIDFKIITKINYIDSSLGSALSYTLGLFLTSKKFNSPSTFYCIIPDSYLSMGEFYENLYLLKNLNDLKKISSKNKLKIIIDFNQKTKLNKINFNLYELKELLELFDFFNSYSNIQFIIINHSMPLLTTL